VLAAVQRPISVACIQQPVPVPRWKELPAWYLLADEDRMINPATQAFMAGQNGSPGKDPPWSTTHRWSPSVASSAKQ